MSNLLIVVNQKNADKNGFADLAAAVTDVGARWVNVDELQGLIQATVPAHEVPTISAMDGVSYVRSVFTYFCDEAPPIVA